VTARSVLGQNWWLGLSRNKVAVPEGAAGTPPFWRGLYLGTVYRCSYGGYYEVGFCRLSLCYYFFCDKLETMVRPGADFSWFFFSFE